MPMTRYQIRNEYSLADPELYRAADKDDPEALLEGVAMAGLVGVLRQLGDLAEFAAEIFHDLHEEVMATAARGHSLMVRVQQLEAEFPSIEKAFLSQIDHSSFFYNAGIDWHPNLQMDQNMITQGDLPRFVMDSYEECRGPPRLFLLDKFDVAGAGACLKRYTDPSFFKFEASASGIPGADFQRERKARKAKKKGSRWKNGETPENLPTSHAKLHQLFLEERIENGTGKPSGRVKLKRRLNGFPFDSKTGKSYMEKFLKTSPEHEIVSEISIDSMHFQLYPTGACGSEHNVLEVNMVGPGKESTQDKKGQSPTNKEENTISKPVFHRVKGVPADNAMPDMSSPNCDYDADSISTVLHVVVNEDVAVDGETQTGGSINGYQSDDIASETDNYVDALTTMESELDTDTELRTKTGLQFLSGKKQKLDLDANDEQLRSHFSDSQSVGNSTISDDGNSSSRKEISSFLGSDTPSTSAGSAHLDGEFSAKVSPSTDFSEAHVTDASFYQHSGNKEVPANQPLGPAIADGRFHDVAAVPRRSDLDEPMIYCSTVLASDPILMHHKEEDFMNKDVLMREHSNEICSSHNALETQSVDVTENPAILNEGLPVASNMSDAPQQPDSPSGGYTERLPLAKLNEEDAEMGENVSFALEHFNISSPGSNNSILALPADNQYEDERGNEIVYRGNELPFRSVCSDIPPLKDDEHPSISCSQKQLQSELDGEVSNLDNYSHSSSDVSDVPLPSKDEISPRVSAASHSLDELHADLSASLANLSDVPSPLGHGLSPATCSVNCSLNELYSKDFNLYPDASIHLPDISETLENTGKGASPQSWPQADNEDDNLVKEFSEHDVLEATPESESTANSLMITLKEDTAADVFVKELVRGRIVSTSSATAPTDKQALDEAWAEIETGNADAKSDVAASLESDVSVAGEMVVTRTCIIDSPKSYGQVEPQILEIKDDFPPLESMQVDTSCSSGEKLDKDSSTIENSKSCDLAELQISGTDDFPPIDSMQMGNPYSPEENLDKDSSTIENSKSCDLVELQISGITNDVLPRDTSEVGTLQNQGGVLEGGRITDAEKTNTTDLRMDLMKNEADITICKDLSSLSKNHVVFDEINVETDQLNAAEMTHSFAGLAKTIVEDDIDSSMDSKQMLEGSLSGFEHFEDDEFDKVYLADSLKELGKVNEAGQQTFASVDLDLDWQDTACYENLKSDVLGIASHRRDLSDGKKTLDLDDAPTGKSMEKKSCLVNEKESCQSNHNSCTEDVLSLPADRNAEQKVELQELPVHMKELLNEGKISLELFPQVEQLPQRNPIDREGSSDTSNILLDNHGSQSSLPSFSLGGNHALGISEQAKDPLPISTPGFGIFPMTNQINLEEMPPLPPLPPVQWRMGKLQHSSPSLERAAMQHSLGSFPSMLPPISYDRGEPSKAISPLSALANENSSPFYPSATDNKLQFGSFSSEEPTMANHRKMADIGILVSSQPKNPFLTSSEASDGIMCSSHDGEGRQEHSNFKSSSDVIPVDSSNSGTSHNDLGESLHAAELETNSEKKLDHGSAGLKGNVLICDTVISKVSPVDPAFTCASRIPDEELVQSLHQVVPEISLKEQNFEEEFANLEENKVSDDEIILQETLADSDPASTSASLCEEKVHILNQAALETSSPDQKLEMGSTKLEHDTVTDGIITLRTPPLNNTLTQAPVQLHEQRESFSLEGNVVTIPQRVESTKVEHDITTLDGEMAWLSLEDEKPNGRRTAKLPRPRNPLIDAVAAHDKSKLRKVTERIRPQIQKGEERDSILEQIRAKSFNLRPTIVSRPSIQGPQTNLKVAAILEKAKTIRQAFAGSDEDDEDSWSDS